MENYISRGAAFRSTLHVNRGTPEGYGERILVSQEEVVYLLGISRTTLWRLVKSGELTGVSIGSRTFVLAKSIDEFISRNIQS